MAEHIIEQANAFAFELEAAARHAEVAGAYVRMAGTLAEPGQTVVLAQAAFAYHDAALNIARAVLGQPDRHDATGMLAVVRADMLTMTQTRMEQGRAVPEQIIDPDAIAFELEAADRHAELAAAYVRTAGTLAEPGQSVVLAQAAFAYREAALNIARAVLGQPDRHDAADLLADLHALTQTRMEGLRHD